jgi:Fe2+ transport system protein FeoA
MPLSRARAGDHVRLRAVRSGHRLQAHLASLGLTPGTEFEVLGRSPGGAVVVSLRGSKVVLGCGMVAKIEVE